MITMPSLAMGGIAAAAVAMWGQVRAAASYMTSFAVVSMQLDDTLTMPMHQMIRRSFKLLPSGQLKYVGRYVMLRGRRNTSILPFKTTHSMALYRRGWRIMVVTLKSDGMRITSIRGLFNYEKLIVEALEVFEERTNSQMEEREKKVSRFQIRKVVGNEKTISGSRERGSAKVSNDSAEISASGEYHIDLSLDESFRYPRSEYVDDVETDPFANLFFDASILRYVEQAKQWMEMGSWYIDRGIPWRRGWLLHSVDGGTGKSSLAKAVAQTLRIPIYHFYLATMSDQEFLEEWESMATPCIALFEDFDTVFHKRESQTEHKSLTFDCVLNAISGVGSLNGVFLMVTTNHIEQIDHAMGVECGRDGISTRPGRIDSVIEVGMLSTENRRKMAHKILRDWPEQVERMVSLGDGVTPIQFQEMCIQTAFDLLSAAKPQLVLEAA